MDMFPESLNLNIDNLPDGEMKEYILKEFIDSSAGEDTDVFNQAITEFEQFILPLIEKLEKGKNDKRYQDFSSNNNYVGTAETNEVEIGDFKDFEQAVLNFIPKHSTFDLHSDAKPKSTGEESLNMFQVEQGAILNYCVIYYVLANIHKLIYGRFIPKGDVIEVQDTDFTPPSELEVELTAISARVLSFFKQVKEQNLKVVRENAN
ncbi:MAG: hypothetical protein ACMG57_01105 [Candidatus Dojkabacteria bacterium]